MHKTTDGVFDGIDKNNYGIICILLIVKIKMVYGIAFVSIWLYT